MLNENKLIAVCCDPAELKQDITKFPTLEQFCNAQGYTDKPVVEKTVENVNNPIAYYGCRGEIVAAIQGALTYNMRLGDTLAHELGSWDSLTDYYIKKFQRENGLSPDGIVGAKTYGKLFRMGDC